MQKLLHIHLLDFDDPVLGPLADMDRMNLLEVIEDSHGYGSMIVTGKLRIGHWRETIGEPSIADAILDRLFHNAYKIKLKGDSMLRSDGLGYT